MWHVFVVLIRPPRFAYGGGEPTNRNATLANERCASEDALSAGVLDCGSTATGVNRCQSKKPANESPTLSPLLSVRGRRDRQTGELRADAARRDSHATGRVSSERRRSYEDCSGAAKPPRTSHGTGRARAEPAERAQRAAGGQRADSNAVRRGRATTSLQLAVGRRSEAARRRASACRLKQVE